MKTSTGCMTWPGGVGDELTDTGGKIGEQHGSEVITYRGENIRIISVRRSRTEEVEIYEN